MYFFCKNNYSALLAWVILISISLVLSQGAHFHVHAESDSHQHGSQDNFKQHSHLTKTFTPYLEHHQDHDFHHDAMVFDIDLNTGVLKNNHQSDFGIEMIAFIFSLIFLLLIPFFILSIQRKKRYYQLSHLLSPPLRGPPLT
jgi:hypothetical protein